MNSQKKSLVDHTASNDVLLKFFVRAGMLTSEVAQDAEAELAAGHQAISAIEWMGNKGLVDEDGLARTMAAHLKLPYANLPIAPTDLRRDPFGSRAPRNTHDRRSTGRSIVGIAL